MEPIRESGGCERAGELGKEQSQSSKIFVFSLNKIDLIIFLYFNDCFSIAVMEVQLPKAWKEELECLYMVVTFYNHIIII